MANDLGNMVSDLVKFVKNPMPVPLANLLAACAATGADTVGAVGWTIPPGKARNDLLLVIGANTHFVHDCNALPNDGTVSALSATLESLAQDESNTQTAFHTFAVAAS